MKSRKHKFPRYVAATAALILTGWLVLTLFVERKGAARKWTIGDTNSQKAIIIFDPDPFYNLDEQICRSFAEKLAENNFQSEIMTVAMAEKTTPENYDLYVFCANTYNWRPDWAITGYINSHKEIFRLKPVVAITLGAGSTKASQKNFEELIVDTGTRLEASYSLWLWRPNDESRPDESNVDVALSYAREWGADIAKEFGRQKSQGQFGKRNAARR